MEKELDWGNLSFGYIPTDYNVRCYYRDGKWGEIEVSSSETVNLHIAATALHYGQEIFEGLKAFRGKDGKVRVFRLEENAKRIIESAKGIKMQEIPVELFTEMVKKWLSSTSVLCHLTEVVHLFISVLLKSAHQHK